MRTKESNLNKKSYFESERMNRRTALKRFGVIVGMAVFSLLTVDDLVRIVSKKLVDNRLYEGLANEFKDTDVAVAQISGNDYDVRREDVCQICGLKHNQTYDPSVITYAGNKFNPACVAHQLRFDLIAKIQYYQS